jgi:hypothetical protein
MNLNKRQFMAGVVITLISLFGGSAFADEDPMSPMYGINSQKPEADLSARPLAGKVVRYGYHSFWEVNKDKGVQGAPAPMVHDVFFYENGECEWFSLDIFAGEHARQQCGTIEVAPNMYQVSWLEPDSKQVVTMILNLNSWTVNSSFHFNSGKGLALWQGRIYSFGEYPHPPTTIPNNY